MIFVLGQFREYLESLNLSEESIRIYLRIIIRFFDDNSNSMDSFDAFEKSYEKWLSEYAPKNASVHKAAAQAYCRFRFGTKIKFKNAFKVSMKNKTPWITKSEYKELISFVHEVTDESLIHRNLAIINVFVYAGLKVAEVASLKMNKDSYWIDLDQNCIWCLERKVPLAAELRTSLIMWIKAREDFQGSTQESFFLSKRGSPMSIRLIQHTLESYYLPGIKITPEILRHSFAKWLILARYDEHVVRKLLRVENSKYCESEEGTVPEVLFFEEDGRENCKDLMSWDE